MEELQKSETSTAEMVTISRAEYDALRAQNEEQSRQIEWLMQQMRLARKKLFGSSSEKTQEEVMDQLSLLFNEAEAYTQAEQPEKTEVAAHTRKSDPAASRKSFRTMFPLKWLSIVFRRKNGSAPPVTRSCRKLVKKSAVRW